MTDDRESFRVARVKGKAKTHEKRLESATYTAAEVKVLTEAALRLGRGEAVSEIAHALAAERDKFLRGYPGWKYLNIALAKALDIGKVDPS